MVVARRLLMSLRNTQGTICHTIIDQMQVIEDWEPSSRLHAFPLFASSLRVCWRSFFIVIRKNSANQVSSAQSQKRRLSEECRRAVRDEPSEAVDHLVQAIKLLVDDDEVVHNGELIFTQGRGVVQRHPSIISNGDGIGELCAYDPFKFVEVRAVSGCAGAGRVDVSRHCAGFSEVVLRKYGCRMLGKVCATEIGAVLQVRGGRLIRDMPKAGLLVCLPSFKSVCLQPKMEHAGTRRSEMKANVLFRTHHASATAFSPLPNRCLLTNSTYPNRLPRIRPNMS